MDEHHGIVVHINHPAAGLHALGDLVGVVRRRDAGADVQKLPDARHPRQVAHRIGQESPLRADIAQDSRIGLNHLLGGLPVNREIILAAQPVVVDPGDVRHAGVQAARGRPARAERALRPVSCHAGLPLPGGL